jgi:hypothetical protein
MKIYSKEWCSGNVLRAEAGTTGFCGGDSGHGGKTYFSIEDLGGTDINFDVSENKLEVHLGGDCELQTITSALKFITSVFEDAMNNKEE